MFGTNPVRKSDLVAHGTLRVQSQFYTIQGEGPFAGIPAFFVRLAGCPLRCFFCDTDFESNYDNLVTEQELIFNIEKGSKGLPSRLIVLTGGDPLRQNVFKFCALAQQQGWHVQAETAGPFWVPGLEQFLIADYTQQLTLPPGMSIVVSPKTPHVASQVGAKALAWKYIVRDTENSQEDGLPVFSTQTKGVRQTLARPPDEILKKQPYRIFLQPCDEGDEGRNKTNTDLCIHLAQKFGYRVGLQQHKILNLE